MNLTASRACLPGFDGHELVRPHMHQPEKDEGNRTNEPSPGARVECIRRLVVVDQEWVPHDTSSSLYIR
jgi:hypothetical protein